MGTMTLLEDRSRLSPARGMGRATPTHPGRCDRISASGRTLHLVDIENLCGDPRPERPRDWLGWYMLASQWRSSDITRIAANGPLAKRLAFEIEEMPHSIRSANGLDGADRRLVQNLDGAFIAQRFERLSPGRGDSYFRDLAVDAARSGVMVEVISRRDSLSGALAAVVDDVYWLPDSWPALSAIRAHRAQRVAVLP